MADDFTRDSFQKRGKRALQVSGTSVLRERDPTNPGVAAHFTNFVFDHSRQLPVIPRSQIGRGQNATGAVPLGDTMNRSGRSANAENVMVGGSPDERSKVLSKPTKLKKGYY